MNGIRNFETVGNRPPVQARENTFFDLDFAMSNLIALEKSGFYEDQSHKDLEDSLMHAIHAYSDHFVDMNLDNASGEDKRIKFARVVDALIKEGTTLSSIVGDNFNYGPSGLMDILSIDSDSALDITDEEKARFMSASSKKVTIKQDDENPKGTKQDSPAEEFYKSGVAFGTSNNGRPVSPLFFSVEPVHSREKPKNNFLSKIKKLIPNRSDVEFGDQPPHKQQRYKKIGAWIVGAALVGTIFVAGFSKIRSNQDEAPIQGLDKSGVEPNSNSRTNSTHITSTTTADWQTSTSSGTIESKSTDITTPKQDSTTNNSLIAEAPETEISTSITEVNPQAEKSDTESTASRSQILQPETVVIIQQRGNLWNSLEQLAGSGGVEADNNQKLQTAIANSLPAIAKANKMTVERLSLLFANQGIIVPPEVLANLVGSVS